MQKTNYVMSCFLAKKKSKKKKERKNKVTPSSKILTFSSDGCSCAHLTFKCTFSTLTKKETWVLSVNICDEVFFSLNYSDTAWN